MRAPGRRLHRLRGSGTRNPQAGDPWALTRSQRGSGLLAVLGISAAVLIVGSALFIMGGSEADLVDYNVDGSRAMYLAEAGVERARGWLWELAKLDPPEEPTEGSFEDQALGYGVYTVTATKLAGGPPTQYEILAKGKTDSVVRQIRTVVQSQNAIAYLHCTHEDDGSFYFITGDTLDGPVHCNQHIKIDGDPWFWEKVTTGESKIEQESGSNPTFVSGYELEVDDWVRPNKDDMSDEFEALALSGGIYGDELSGGDAKYEVELGRNDSLGYLSYRAYEDNGGYAWSSWTDVEISTTNGAAWFREPTWITGTLDGQVTICTHEEMYIPDDILYADSTPGQGPDPGCDDLLGLAVRKHINIVRNTPNETDCEIHAAIIAPDGELRIEEEDKGTPRGDLIIHGAILLKKPKPTGTHDDGNILTGYRKVFRYDTRLRSTAPPHFPDTSAGSFYVVTWKEELPPGS